jgi:hypothetical protein
MTKTTKYVLLGATALVLIGGAFVSFIAAIIGIAVMSAETGEISEKSTDAPRVSSRAKGKGSVPPELVGVWWRTEGSGHVDYTGKTQYRSGAEHTYKIATDGSVEYSLDKKVLTILQCNLEETKRAEGTATASGKTLTINFGEMEHTNSNSCDASEDFERTTPDSSVSMTYILKTEYEITRLCLIEDEIEQCYDRKDE